ncbi:MAG TPA: H4MPT-linked C1 transfer pathway protein [Methanocorpusculum sp.]|nr:H4MPT-linked C1 transfer pathway protein [Methanocorpusculum sp.]
MIGIDVGGANLKVVDEAGVHIHYCPLWKDSPLADIIAKYKDAGSAAVVMSGELADGFFNKSEGISVIVDAVKQTFPDAVFYGMDGKFHTEACFELAAANWLASVAYLRKLYPNGLLLDIGSTTTDIVPLKDFEKLIGMTDTLRLQKGYLIYTGMLRTPVATLASSAIINGVRTPFSTEYFACSGDVNFVLGNITKEEYTATTPDGKEVSRDACLRRLARTVCADLEEIGEDGAVAIADVFWEAQKKHVCEATLKTKILTQADIIFVGGIGSKTFAPLVGGIDLTEATGIPADALPAFAVREIALET